MSRGDARGLRASLAAFALAVFVGLVGLAPAAAQTGPAAPERTDDELRDDGWVFDEESARPGSIRGGVMALTLGTAWHGAGHAVVGDRRTSQRLFAAQGIGVGVAAGGLLLRTLGDTSPEARTSATAMMVTGGSLFAASWVADVVGAFKGTAAPLPPNSDELEGVTVEGYFTTLVEDGLELNNILVARVPVVAERWRLRPEAEIGLDVGYRRFAMRAGWRAPFGAEVSGSFVEIGAIGADENTVAHGYGRTHLAGGATLNLDVGDAFPHLRGLEWQHRVEVAVDYAYFDSDSDRRFDGANRTVHVPVEMGVGFNANQGVHLGFGYRHRRDTLVGMSGTRVGSFWGRLGILPRNRIGVDLMIEQGAYTRAWFGLHWALVRTN